jgi:hypothetical protein
LGRTLDLVQERRNLIRARALHANRCQDKDEPPAFEITEAEVVFCTHDGRPVTDQSQILAEKCYWVEVERGAPGLIHDEEAEAFYTLEDELALSRNVVHLENLMGEERMEAWKSESHKAGLEARMPAPP